MEDLAPRDVEIIGLIISVLLKEHLANEELIKCKHDERDIHHKAPSIH